MFSSTTIFNFIMAAFAYFWTLLSAIVAMKLTKVPEPAKHIVKMAATNAHSLLGYSVSHNRTGRIAITGKDTVSTLKGKVRLFLSIRVVALVFGIILTPIAYVEYNYLYRVPNHEQKARHYQDRVCNRSDRTQEFRSARVEVHQLAYCAQSTSQTKPYDSKD